MPDKELILEILNRIEESTEKIVTRFINIHNVSGFTDSPAGVEKNGLDCNDVDSCRRIIKKS